MKRTGPQIGFAGPFRMGEMGGRPRMGWPNQWKGAVRNVSHRPFPLVTDSGYSTRLPFRTSPAVSEVP